MRGLFLSLLALPALSLDRGQQPQRHAMEIDDQGLAKLLHEMESERNEGKEPSLMRSEDGRNKVRSARSHPSEHLVSPSGTASATSTHSEHSVTVSDTAATASSATASSATSSGLVGYCVIPMWDQDIYVCEEHLEVARNDMWLDPDGVKRKRLIAGSTCTVQCKTWWQRYYKVASPLELYCDKATDTWVQKDGHAKIEEISCDVAKWAYLSSVLIIVLIIAGIYFFCRRRSQQKEALLAADANAHGEHHYEGHEQGYHEEHVEHHEEHHEQQGQAQ